MSDKRTPKRKLAVDSLVSSTVTKKPRASAAKATHGTELKEAGTSSNQNEPGSSTVHVEWVNDQEVVTTTTITERTISLRNKTISTPVLSRSTSRTSRKSIEAGAEAGGNNDEHMDIDSESDASDVATPAKRLYRRSSVGSTASVESASRPTNRRRTSAGAFTLIAEQQQHVHPVSQDVGAAGAASATKTSSSARGSRRRATFGAAAAQEEEEDDSDAYSVAASETPSIASAVKAARGRTARVGATAATSSAATSPRQSNNVSVSVSAGSSSSSKGKGSRLSKHQQAQQSQAQTQQLHMHTSSTTVPASHTITTVPPLPVPVPVLPAPKDASVTATTTITTSAAAAVSHTQPEDASAANGTSNGIPFTTTAAATTATEQPAAEEQLDISDFLALAARHVLTMLLVLLLAAVAVLFLQYHQPQLQPSATGGIQTRAVRNNDSFAPTPTTVLAPGQLLAEIVEQEEAMRRISETLDQVRQDWNNASTAANQAAAAVPAGEPHLLFVKLREENVMLEGVLRKAETDLHSQLQVHQKAIQAEAEAQAAFAARMEATVTTDVKPAIDELRTEASQLHKHVDAQVSALNSLLKAMNVSDHPPALPASLTHSDQRAVLEAQLNATAADVQSATANLERIKGDVDLSSAQEAVQKAGAREEKFKSDYASAGQKLVEDAATVLDKAQQTAREAEQQWQTWQLQQRQQEGETGAMKEEVVDMLEDPEETVSLSEEASATIIQQAAAPSVAQILRSAQQSVEGGHQASLNETSAQVQREQEQLLQGALAKAAATEENTRSQQQEQKQVQQPEGDGITDVSEEVDELHLRHDFAVGVRGGQVLHHRYMCPAFGGSQLTSPPYTNYHKGGAAQPLGAITDVLGSVAATFKRTVSRSRASVSSAGSSSGSRVSRQSSEAKVLVSHLRPSPDSYYALSTKRLRSATSSVHRTQVPGLLSGGRGGDDGDAGEGYAGQVTILFQEAVYVESVKLLTVAAPSTTSVTDVGDDEQEPHREQILACAPERFRLVGWTEDPRRVREVRGRQFDLGTHVFDSPQPTYDDVTGAIGSGSNGDSSGCSISSKVYEQQFLVPIEYAGEVVPALKAVTVHVLSNYGEQEFTCLHRVQILGILEKYLYA